MTINGLQIKMVAGDSKTIDVAVTDADGTATDLTGTTLRWSVAPVLKIGEQTFGDTVLAYEGAPRLTVPVAGTVRLSLPKGAVPAGEWHHELEVTWDTGESETVARGLLIAYASIRP
jgi:hypothetical protein